MLSWLKVLLKRGLPPFVLRRGNSLFISRLVLQKQASVWSGDYKHWDDAAIHASGYDEPEILEMVKQAALKVKNGEAAFERDSVTFAEPQYSWPIITALLWAASEHNGCLRVLDFGGSLGSCYFQYKTFLKTLNSVSWNVVEQGDYVRVGKEFFEQEELHFYASINECLRDREVDIVLLSSVLQYLPNPYGLLDEVVCHGMKLLVIDLTPVFKNRKDRLTVQRVPRSIYKASYPCWILSERKLINTLVPTFELIASFPSYVGNELYLSTGAAMGYSGYIFRSKK